VPRRVQLWRLAAGDSVPCEICSQRQEPEAGGGAPTVVATAAQPERGALCQERLWGGRCVSWGRRCRRGMPDARPVRQARELDGHFAQQRAEHPGAAGRAGGGPVADAHAAAPAAAPGRPAARAARALRTRHQHVSGAGRCSPAPCGPRADPAAPASVLDSRHRARMSELALRAAGVRAAAGGRPRAAGGAAGGAAAAAPPAQPARRQERRACAQPRRPAGGQARDAQRERPGARALSLAPPSHQARPYVVVPPACRGTSGVTSQAQPMLPCAGMLTQFILQRCNCAACSTQP